MSMHNQLNDVLNHIIEWSLENSTAKRIIGNVFKTGKAVYTIPNRLRYRMVKRKTEAFFERGRLYQLTPANNSIKLEMALYANEDMELAYEEADRGDYTPFLLKKTPRKLCDKQVFMLLEIKRYRFDYALLKVLAGDQVNGIILHGDAAMYPWEVFTDITE